MNTTQIRIRLGPDDIETLKRLAEDTSLAQIDLATMFLHAALVTVAKNGYRFQFPPAFKLVEFSDSEFEMTRPKTPSRK